MCDSSGVEGCFLLPFLQMCDHFVVMTIHKGSIKHQALTYFFLQMCDHFVVITKLQVRKILNSAKTFVRHQSLLRYARTALTRM
jgi:hypothetical protein